MNLKSEKRKGWHCEAKYSKWVHCNFCAAPFSLDDNYIVVRDNGLSRADRKVFECPICRSTDLTYLQEIHLPAIRQMIAVTIVHAYEDYIKDRNQLGERGKFLNRKFINEAELWLFENKGTEPLSLHWCCEMLDISKWKIRQICKKQREEKDRGCNVMTAQR